MSKRLSTLTTMVMALLLLTTLPLTAQPTGEVTDEHGIIVKPADGLRQVYSRSGWCLKNDDGVRIMEQGGTMHIVTCDDGTVYIRNILVSYPTGTWVKGQKEGNTITVPTRQPVYWNEQASVTYSVGWCMYESEWDSYSTYDSYSDVITFEIDPEAQTISLQNSSRETFIALLWDDDDSFAWHGDWESVWTYEQDYEPLPVAEVTPPATMTTAEWYVRGHQTVAEVRQVVKGRVTVGFDGNDVYLKGIFAQYPDAWMKGTAEDGIVTFDGMQILGTQDGEQVYAVGMEAGDLTPFVMTYNAESQVLSSTMSLIANTSTTDIAVADSYDDITIQISDPYAPIESLPYRNDIDTEEDFEWFTVIDANQDETTWQYYYDEQGFASCKYNSDNNADDWLISPAFRLEAGKTYSMAIDMNTSSEYYTERFEVMMGSEATAEAMTTEVIAARGINNESPVTFDNKLITVPETGIYYFGIHAISDADQASLRASHFFVDETVLEAPVAVSDLTVTANSEEGFVTVAFTTPGTNIGGESLTEALTVDIIRDNEKLISVNGVATNSPFTYKDAEVDFGTHSYSVTVSNSHGQSSCQPVSVTLTPTYDVPYVADFSEDDTFSLFTTIDNNDDGSRWENNIMYAAYEYNSVNDGDDYLITPGIRLEAGKTYNIIVEAEAAGDFHERFEVLIGQGTTVEAQTTTVIDPVEIVGSEGRKPFENTFSCTESGIYNVAVHCISDADMYALWIHKLTVEIGPLPTAPAAPELSVTAAENGELKADISITAPTTAIDGSELTVNLEKIELYRDEELIATRENVAPGDIINIIDEEMSNGSHTYQAIAYNADGAGKKSERVSVYTGIDAPTDVANVTIKDQLTSVVLTWDAVSVVGANGGYVDPTEVDYKIWACEPGSTLVFASEPVATVHGVTTCELPFITNEGEQTYQSWVVTSANNSGESYLSSATPATLTIGRPYDLPVRESFADGRFHYYCDYVGLPMTLAIGSDGDDSALALTSQQENSLVAFTTGKLNIKDAKNPTLIVDAAAFGADNFSIIATRDGQEAEIIKSAELGQNYQTIEVSLADWQDAEYIMLGFMAHINKATVLDDWTGELVEEGDAIVLDNMRIIDKMEHNLAVTLSAPESLQAGIGGSILATITNWGQQPAANYTIDVKAGDNDVMMEEMMMPELESYDSYTMPVSIPTSIFTEAGPMTVTATIVYAADEDSKDNTAEVVITITDPVTPAPTDLIAEEKDDVGVGLSWTAPETAVLFTESFENGMGGWTTLDKDEDGFDWIHSMYGESEVYMETNTGLGCVYSESFSNASSKALTPDNWLVSPQLILDGTFSFYAKGQDPDWCDEHFAVYVTTGDPTDTDSYQQVSEELVASSTMTEYSVDLSEYEGQTGYVAIRHFNVSDMYTLVVDDISYTMGGQPTSYRIYCDGKIISTVTGGETTCILPADDIAAGMHTFAVTAVYNNGQESRPAVATLATSIDEIVSDGHPVDVYSLDGRMVRRQATTLSGLHGVYVIEGMTVIVK